MSNFEMQIASPSNREKLVVEYYIRMKLLLKLIKMELN